MDIYMQAYPTFVGSNATIQNTFKTDFFKLTLTQFISYMSHSHEFEARFLLYVRACTTYVLRLRTERQNYVSDPANNSSL